LELIIDGFGGNHKDGLAGWQPLSRTNSLGLWWNGRRTHKQGVFRASIYRKVGAIPTNLSSITPRTKPLTKARHSVIVDLVPHTSLPPAKLED
jgi:hypothetical protein